MQSHYTLGLIPGESTVFQKCYSNLGMLDIIIQPYKLEVCVKLVHKPTHAHPIHRALKVVGQTRLDRSRQALSNRLSGQMLVCSSKISLQLCNWGLQVCNNLVDVNCLLLCHGCGIRSTMTTREVPRVHTHTHTHTQRYQGKSRSITTPETICEVNVSLYTILQPR